MGQHIDRSTSLRHWTKGVQFVLYTLFEMIAIGHVKSHMHDYYQCQTIIFLSGHVRIDMSTQCPVVWKYLHCVQISTLFTYMPGLWVHTYILAHMHSVVYISYNTIFDGGRIWH